MRPQSLAPLLALLLFVPACGGDEASDDEKDRAVAAAQRIYEGEIQGSKYDFESGPCIAEELPGLPDWVADIAHDPRTDVDDQAENQCQRYRDGEAHHFVELTPDGELIRAE